MSEDGRVWEGFETFNIVVGYAVGVEMGFEIVGRGGRFEVDVLNEQGFGVLPRLSGERSCILGLKDFLWRSGGTYSRLGAPHEVLERRLQCPTAVYGQVVGESCSET